MSVNAKRCAENFATANERAAALAAGDGGEQLTACLQRRMFSKGLCVSNNNLLLGAVLQARTTSARTCQTSSN